MRRLQAREALRLAEDAELRGVPEATQTVAVADPLRERWGIARASCPCGPTWTTTLHALPSRGTAGSRGRVSERSLMPDGRPASRCRRRLGSQSATQNAEIEQKRGGRGGGEEPGQSGGVTGAPAAVQPRKGETAEEKRARKAATKEANVRRLSLLAALATESAGLHLLPGPDATVPDSA